MRFQIHKVFFSKYLKFLFPSANREWKLRNRYIFSNRDRPIVPNRVNLCWCGESQGKVSPHENLGDYLSLVIVDYMLKNRGGVSLHSPISDTKSLYAIGSIIGWGYQDATIWGSGLLKKKNALRCLRQKLDIRAVRGPLTRNALQEYGIMCPEVYGDPAVLLSEFWKGDILPKKHKYSIILHHNSTLRKAISVDELERLGFHWIEIQTTDYKGFVNELISSEVVISSALHGIILSESYGIPTIWLKEDLGQDIKFMDWFLATNRNRVKYITDISQVDQKLVNELPNLQGMKDTLKDTFPYDLWESNL